MDKWHPNCEVENESDFSILNVEAILMAIKTAKPKLNAPSFRTPASSATPSAPPPSPKDDTLPPYWGDLVVLFFWVGCAALIAAMICYETIVGLLFRR